jgi:hypothetical protein
VTVIPIPPPVRIDPNTIDYMLFYYTENMTPADRYAFKLVKEMSKYVTNVTYCEFNTTYHTIFKTTPDPTPPGEPVAYTPAVIVHFKNGKFALYHGISTEYLVPDSINWLYAKITGNVTLPPAQAPLEEYHFHELNDPMLFVPPPPDPNHIPKPITPLNPNDIKMIIFAEYTIGPASDEVNNKAFQLTKEALKYAPHAKLIKLTDYSWFDKGVKSDPPGYEHYWEKYVIPYTKYQVNEGDWYLALPALIIFLKDGSVKVYVGANTNKDDSDFQKKCQEEYEDWCKLVKIYGKKDHLTAYPPTEKLFLDIWAYLDNQTKTRIN